MIRIHAIRTKPTPPKPYNTQAWHRYIAEQKTWATTMLRIETGRAKQQ